MSVNGLLGTSVTRRLTFSQGINIIYGRNGKGKTAILSLISGAFNNSTSGIIHTPFKECRVDIDAQEYAKRVVKSISKKLIYQSPINESSFYDDQGEVDYIDMEIEDLVDETAFQWKNLDSTQSSFPLEVTFLEVDRLHKFSISETSDESDKFTQSIKTLWTIYNNQLMSKIKDQQDDIIFDLLMENETKFNATDEEVKIIYDKVMNFANKRAHKKDLQFEMTLSEFALKYHDRVDFRRIVNSIVSAELNIDAIDEPRNALLHILQDLFSEDITIKLFRNNIHFYSKNGKRIYLNRLSSGEKHVLFILINVAVVGSGILLIDEPELSMHVMWQRKLLDAISLLNPQAQIIMATHSPEIVSSRKDINFIKI